MSSGKSLTLLIALKSIDFKHSFFVSSNDFYSIMIVATIGSPKHLNFEQYKRIMYWWTNPSFGEFSGTHILTLTSNLPPGDGKRILGDSKQRPSVTETNFVSSGQNSLNLLMTLHVFQTIVPGLAIMTSSFESSNSYPSIQVI